jgi:hypothetical protein
MEQMLLCPRGASDRTFNDIALRKEAVFYCPICKKQLAVADRQISWWEKNWTDALRDKMIVKMSATKYICAYCQSDISGLIIHPINWDRSNEIY